MRSTAMLLHWKLLYSVLVLALTGYNSQSSVSAASGPHNSAISWTGQVTAGFSTTFTCSASCFPPCTYNWSFKGAKVNGSRLTWTPDGLDSVVELQCTVLNPDSGEFRIHTTIVEVKNRVSVQASPRHTLPSLNQPQSLVCQGANPGLPVVWYKDGQKVTLHERISLLEHNTTLHFYSLQPPDAGFYQCEATMPTLQENSAFSQGYLLSFDPWHVTISGPDRVLPDRQSTFTCLTSCTIDVDCTVKWEFRGGFPIGTHLSMNTNVLTWTPSIPGTFQNITCVAKNAAAGRTAEGSKTVEVVGIPLSGSEMVRLSGVFTQILSLGLLFLFNS